MTSSEWQGSARRTVVDMVRHSPGVAGRCDGLQDVAMTGELSPTGDGPGTGAGP